MDVKRLLLLILVLLVVLGFLFRAQTAAEGKVVLLTTAVFPSPIEPLDWFTRAPVFEHVTFSGPAGAIEGNLFLPRPLIGSSGAHSERAIIIALGVKVPRSAVSQIDNFASSLARLGYVTLWPRRKAFIAGQAPMELPSTFVRSFVYLAHQHVVDPRYISYLGLSVGASTALVAASRPRISRRVHALVFFAGDYSLFDYIASLATGRDIYRGREVRWHPSSDAIQQVKRILQDENAPDLLRAFSTSNPRRARAILDSAPASERKRLLAFDPAAHIHGYHAATWILDDTGDAYVPYVESKKLKDALPSAQVRGWLLSDLFQHVLPSTGNLPHLLQGLLSFNAFAYSAFRYL